MIPVEFAFDLSLLYVTTANMPRLFRFEMLVMRASLLAILTVSMTVHCPQPL